MSAPTEKLLSIRDLSVAFGKGAREVLAVDRVSFDIGKGETVALVGESGSGKSVTALSVMKLLPYPAARHPAGSVLFKGRELLTMPEDEIRHLRGNDITIIFQEPMTSLNPLHTIEKQIREILLIHQGLAGEKARARIVGLLGQVGIPDPEGRLGSYPHQLSGGQPTSRPPRSTSPCRRKFSSCSRTRKCGSACLCCSSPTTSASCASSPTACA